MDLGSEFYTEWFAWAEKRAPEIAKTNPLGLASFAADLAAIVKSDVTLFQSLGKALSGGVFGIALGVGKWVSRNPDPLKPQREAMRAMRVKYGEVAGG